MVRMLISAAMLLGAATTVQAGSQQQADIPSVLVIKAPLDKNGQQTDIQTAQGAMLVPLSNVQIERNAQGEVDQDKLAAACAAQLDQAQGIALQTLGTDAAGIPDAVQTVFQTAQQGRTLEDLNWRFWNPWGNGGFYGYGYNPYWGYYNNLYPYYGYYDNYYTYPYSYGFYRPYNNWGYYYYWR